MSCTPLSCKSMQSEMSFQYLKLSSQLKITVACQLLLLIQKRHVKCCW
jgi:hypothetical protein